MLSLTESKSTNAREVCKSKVEEQAIDITTQVKPSSQQETECQSEVMVLHLIATQRLFFLDFFQALYATL